MAKIPVPAVQLPVAPAQYNQREEQEFRRLVTLALGEAVEDLVRPSLVIEVTPSATEYEIVVTWTGTMVYRVDGAGPFAGGTSPQTFTVDRNTDPGPAIVYSFTVTRGEQSTTDTVPVLPVPATPEAAIIITEPQTANNTTDQYTYSWTTVGMPGGETYRVEYVYQDTAGTPEGRVPVLGTGVVDPATSGGTINSPVDIGVAPTFDLIVKAFVGTDQIAYARKTGTFAT